MADSGRSAGGVAPSSFHARFRPSRMTPYDRPGLHRSTPHDPSAIGPSKVPPRPSTQYGPPAIGLSKVPLRSSTKGISTQYGPPGGPPAIGLSKVPLRSSTKGISTQYGPPAIGPSKVPIRSSTKGISTQYGPPAIGPSKVPLRSSTKGISTQYGPPPIGPSKVPLRSSTQYGPSAIVPSSSSTQYGPPAIGPSNFSPLLHPAMDLSKVPPCLHCLYPYGPPFSFLAGLPESTLFDAYDLPALDPPAIGCLNNPCDSSASRPSSDLCLNDTPSPVSNIIKELNGYQCFICEGKGLHNTVLCPFLVLAAQLDVVKDNPPKEWEFYRYVVSNERVGRDGYGVGFYYPPKEGDIERSAADAMMLYKDGLNLIRIACLPENNRDPERLCRQLEKFGPVAYATVCPDQSFGFVKFISRDSAKKAIEVLNKNSDCGYLMWAMQIPE